MQIQKSKKNLWFLLPLLTFLLLVFILLQDIIELYPTLENSDGETIKTALRSLGVKGAIVMGFIQAIQMLLVFLPSEFIQIIAGATYGIWQGSLLILVGFELGAIVIYLLVNICNLKIENLFGKSKSYELLNKLNDNKSSVSKLLIFLFFMPAIPIGLLCYFGSTTKISFRRYITVVTIGMIPSIVIDCCLGGVIVASLGKNFWWLFAIVILTAVLALMILNSISKRKINKELYGTPKPTRQMEVDAFCPHKANPFFYAVLKCFSNFWFVKRNNAEVDSTQIKDLKAPYVILATHPSFYDFAYAINATKQRVNPVVNKFYYFDKAAYPIVKVSNCIPKMLFTTDISTVKNCFKAIKNGSILLMMPEGRLSIDGSNQAMPSGIDKLIKKLNVPVVAMTSTGAYLTKAKWMKYKHKGKINVKLTPILSQEDVSQKTVEEISEIIVKSLTFNDFEHQKSAQQIFKCKNMLAGVDGILYHCPDCHSEYTLVGDHNTIKCTHCGKQITMDNKYNFVDSPYPNISNIQDWYRYQVEYEKNIIANNDVCMSVPVVLKTYQKYGKGLEIVGNGTLTLTKTELTFDGTRYGEPHKVSIDVKQLDALAFSCNLDVECYINNEFYWFEPTQNAGICTKMSLYVDILNSNV